MASNQDILAFLRSDKEARDKEKVQETEIRARERDQDMAKLAEMIRTGVRDEVKLAVQPVEDRIGKQEETSQGLTVQIQTLMTEMITMKDEIKIIKEYPPLPIKDVTTKDALAKRFMGTRGVAAKVIENSEANRDTAKDEAEQSYMRLLEICSKARKIIGFKPIEPRMLEIQKNSYGARNLKEAMLMEIRSYLKCEMKMPHHEIEKLEIVRIFPPAKEDWNTLYVEFGSEYEVDRVFRHIRVMVKKDHKVVRWFPKELYERFQALDSTAYAMREEMKEKGVMLRTKVIVGKDDLEFSTKLENGRWRFEPLPKGLPKIDLEARGRPSMSSSPPPGRPDRAEDDRKRQHSGSDMDESAKKSKTHLSRQDSNRVNLVRDKEGAMVADREDAMGNRQDDSVGYNKQGGMVVDKEGDLVGGMQGIQDKDRFSDVGAVGPSLRVDKGIFTNQEGYSPATPAKTKSIPDLSVIANSPILKSKARSIQQ